MKKVIIFTFNKNPMCLMHALLNTLDMNRKGIPAKIIFEGEAVKLIKEMEESKNKIYLEVKEKGFIEGFCKACSKKFQVLDFNEKTGIKMLGEMKGHPSFASYMKEGFDVMTL